MPDIFVSKEAKEEKKEVVHKKELPKEKKIESASPTYPVSKKKRHRYSPFNSYMYRPQSVGFETKQKDEEILLLLRRHPITNVPWIVITILMILAPLGLRIFPILDFLPPNYFAVAVISWYLIVFAFALENFLIWFFNVSIVTNKRIVDIDFHNLLYKEVSDAEIENIEDVTYKMGGAVRTIFDYGDVLVQTASEVPNFDFLAVPKPDEVVKVLQQLRDYY